MASTNKTTTLDLSQFVGTDKPDWLTDYNEDMEKIDAFATVAQSDIETANSNAAAAKNTANAASTAANQASATAGTALTNTNTTNANIANWQGNTELHADSFWTAANTVSLKFNKTLGIFHLMGYLSSGSTTFAAEQAICTLPVSARPNTQINIRAGAFCRNGAGEQSNCTVTITPAGIVSVGTIITPSFTPVNLYMNIFLAAAGWGNDWPTLNQI